MWNHKKNREKDLICIHNFVEATQKTFESYESAIDILTKELAELILKNKEQDELLQTLSANNNVFIKQISALEVDVQNVYNILSSIKVDEKSLITLN